MGCRRRSDLPSCQNEGEEDHIDDRLQNNPKRPEGHLPVFRLDILQDIEPEQVAVFPQLAQAKGAEAFGRLNSDNLVGHLLFDGLFWRSHGLVGAWFEQRV